ncbi:hypothetical protein [Natrinema salifodinae]|uniref:Uncharacterized protein n=1 Tax=Natrinema salifodinae TaxID=1202768 RepID=A0A1I0MK80_9EURY|nr:hypothetical protein [Natrinema salifodinae]SEV88236.1 hypothetical protein SAMN05216285_1023 [Natrinema salifodinae]
MDGKIIGEDDVDIGVGISDNNGAQHQIEMHKKNGKIYAHQCENYPDKVADRTLEENEYNAQARKFAQYYVYLERGYDTVRPRRNHAERINAARVALGAAPRSEFKELCGDLYWQLRSHYEDSERIIEIPEAAANHRAVVYRTNVYLGLDPTETDLHEEATELAATYGLDRPDRSLSERSVTDLSANTLNNWVAFSQDLGRLAVEKEADLSEGLYVDAVSPVYMQYRDAAGNVHTTDVENPYERDPDTRIEMPVVNPGSLDEFQDYINYHLACQVRDSFVRMGLEPPEPFQILGHGDVNSAIRYKRLDMYPNYIDPDEETAFA